MLTSVLSAILVINEVMASNAGVVLSPAINFDSWIELYNPTDAAVSLDGMTLSDDEGHSWQLPKGMGSVPAGGFKVVWMGSDDIKDTQAPFKLNCDGGTITLTARDGSLVAQQSYPEALSRTAWARTTDGGDQWAWTSTPTPEATNATARYATERLAPPVVSQGSQLFPGTLNVVVDIPEGATLMYTTDGSLPQAPKKEDEDTSPWNNHVSNSDCEGDDDTCLRGKDGDGDGSMNPNFVEGAGHDGSRGIKVHAVANAQEDWTTQFFVYTPDHYWNAGDKYRFHMWVRADKPAHVSVQSHRTPGSYIHWQMLKEGGYNITTEWQEIVYEGTITAKQAGVSSGGWGQPANPSELQTIAFNLNESRQENNFYFDDITWESYEDEGRNTDSSQRSKDGKFRVTATTAYTFRLFQEGYLPSPPVTRSYIHTDNEYTFPVISIVGDKRYFTDPKIGIDCDGDGTNGRTGNGQDRPRNYNMPWDRPVNFSFIGTDGQMAFNQDVNISVSGGWTRSQPERSFKLKANKVFDGQNRFDYSFFPQKPYIRNKALLVRNGGNDVWTHHARFIDPALQTIIQRSEIDVDVQSYVPIIEYVNGQCRGVLNLRETNNDKFAYANFGYDDEELDMFENFQFKLGTPDALNRIYELGRHINDAGAYDELLTLLDIDEFTNWMAVELYLGNQDWPDNNIKAYRSQKDGRYRFVCFDLDYVFGLRYNTNNDNPFTFFTGFSHMEFVSFFLNLLEHDGFRRKFIDTFCIMGGSVFERKRAEAIVDELANRLYPMLQLTGDSHSPQSCVATIKRKLQNRLSRMITCIREFQPMQLTTAKRTALTLKADTEGARLMVNDTEVPYADFNGTLFHPVSLKAIAPAGYRFAGWEQNGLLIDGDETISLPDATSVNLVATFEPLSDEERMAQGFTPVRINEVSAANGIYVNEHFKRNDWVELYNTTDQPIDVEGMFLSDNAKKPQKYQISKGEGLASTVIPAHGHLVVWCDGLQPLSQLHATFKLAAEGGDVLLTAADGSWTDRFAYTAMNSDQTAARYPDGGSQVLLMNVPTIAKANHPSSYATDIEQPVPSAIDDLLATTQQQLTVRFVAGRLAIHGNRSLSGDVAISIVNLSGQTVGRLQATLSEGYADASMGHLPAGVYVATVSDGQGNTSTCKFAINN